MVGDREDGGVACDDEGDEDDNDGVMRLMSEGESDRQLGD